MAGIQVRCDLYPPLQKRIRVRSDLYPPLQKRIRVRSDLYPQSNKIRVRSDLYPQYNEIRVRKDLYPPLQNQTTYSEKQNVKKKAHVSSHDEKLLKLRPRVIFKKIKYCENPFR